MSQIMWRSIRRAGIVQAALSLLLAAYMVLVKRTTRWTVINGEIVEGVWKSGGGVIGALWHARVLMTIAGWPPQRKDIQKPKILISLSPDGEFVARAAELLKVGVVRGSTARAGKKEKGGAAASREILDHLLEGGCMAMTPDGPRGPRMRAGMGAIRLAQISQTPILSYAWSSSRRVVFKSWDRFVLPLPFGKGVIVWGELIRVPRHAGLTELAALREKLESGLIAITQQADRLAGVPAIEPASPHERRKRAGRSLEDEASDLEALG